MEKIQKTSGEVQMVEDGPVNMNFTQFINGVSRLGKEIRISPKAKVYVNNAGFKAQYFVETVTLNIGIGKDHTAELIMTMDAWKALQSGEKINVVTMKEFIRNGKK
jgi:hypothetical protein